MEYINPTTGKPYEFTLDNVTPYQATETFTPPTAPVLTSQFTQTEPPPATGYAAPTYSPSKDATVEGRMGGLLSKGSPYMTAARTTGIQSANARGLLNTSLAGEASQKAAIESALPIAQQDASTYATAGQTGYEGEIAGGLATQKYGNDASLVGVQGATSAKLSAQEATQNATQTAYEAAISSGLSEQEAKQQAALTGYQAGLQSGLSEQESVQNLIQTGYQAELGAALSAQEAKQQEELVAIQAEASSKLSAQEAAQTKMQSAYDAAVASGLSEQEAKQTSILTGYQAQLQSGLSAQEAAQSLGLAGFEGELAAALSEQEAAQNKVLEGMKQEWANYRYDLEAETDRVVAAMNLSSAETTSLGSSISSMGEQFMAQLTAIQTNPNLTEEAKTEAIRILYETYRTNMGTTTSVYGTSVTWDEISLSPVKTEEKKKSDKENKADDVLTELGMKKSKYEGKVVTQG